MVTLSHFVVTMCDGQHFFGKLPTILKLEQLIRIGKVKQKLIISPRRGESERLQDSRQEVCEFLSDFHILEPIQLELGVTTCSRYKRVHTNQKG